MNLKEELQELKRVVESALLTIEIQPVFEMSAEELLSYKKMYGEFDFIIGDFGVTNIRKRQADPVI